MYGLGYGFYGFGLDPTYILIIIGIILCLIASRYMHATFNKYNRIRNARGLTGAQVAEQILRTAGIYDVAVEHVSGNLSDHFDPRSMKLRLSDSTYNSMSVAALGVAAHECGHAIQHQKGYAPLAIRGALVPVANIGSWIAWPLIIIGFLINSNSSDTLINLGILAFSLSVLFQIVTLPVEFNASKRAVRILDESNILYEEEVPQARKVLRAAALTYVASAAASILQLLRLVLLSNSRRD
ncbi:MAG: zinc metallopeptidase [Lachnospiraceae bacterium]|jgi:Zn-dependent membrane protease YugP|nr:zinc metallopeptidase [Lachnospiraceae bacterium]